MMETVKTSGRVVTALVAVAGLLVFGVATESVAALGEPGQEAVGPQITGFRSSLFGMSKAETVEAIQRDFQLEQAEIVEQQNAEDRTSSLVATVTDIFPGSSPARVVYIHGYRQRKLIQVNILWGLPVTEDPDPQALVTTANVLRKYFSDLGFAPEQTVLNTRVDDSILIVFRATDEHDRMVLLQLISGKVPVAQGEGGENAEPQNRVVSLWLSYVENTKDPDMFRIERGMF